MLKTLSSLFEKVGKSNSQESLSQHDLNLAIAALLVEVATIDQHLDETEWQTLQALLVNSCQLTKTEALTLAEEAKQASAEASSLYEFTQKANQHCSYQQKLDLVAGLWKVAYADGNLDKYEEHIIRRVADLIHVSHADFIKMKITVRDENA